MVSISSSLVAFIHAATVISPVISNVLSWPKSISALVPSKLNAPFPSYPPAEFHVASVTVPLFS